MTTRRGREGARPGDYRGVLSREVEGPCGKTIFRSSKAARTARKHVKNRFRTYYCKRCGGWHITQRHS